MSAHTPGPWEISVRETKASNICTVYGTREGWVEIYAPNGGGAEDYRAGSSANAILITASPRLLAALEALVKTLAFHDEEGLIEHAVEMVEARAAIAQARGML